MLEQGIVPSKIAKKLRVSTKSAYTWRRTWRAGGSEALLSKGPGGATCQLTDEQLGWLRADLAAGPAAFGWGDDQRWTAARVVDLIFAEFTVSYTAPRSQAPIVSVCGRGTGRVSMAGLVCVKPDERTRQHHGGAEARHIVADHDDGLAGRPRGRQVGAVNRVEDHCERRDVPPGNVVAEIGW